MRGAQGRNRTTDTRIFSRRVGRFLFKYNGLRARDESVLRSVLEISRTLQNHTQFLIEQSC